MFHRPEVTGVLGSMFSALDNFNNFYNLAPSLHIALRTILWAVYIPITTGPLQLIIKIWFILVGASTLFCWQHHVLDVISGQILGLVTLYIYPQINDPKLKPNVIISKKTNSDFQIGVYYLIGSLIFFILTIYTWIFGVLFLWPAIALVIVSGAYFGDGPAVFQKYNGKFSTASRWLLLPYRLCSKMTFFI